MKYNSGKMKLGSTRHGFDRWTTCTMCNPGEDHRRNNRRKLRTRVQVIRASTIPRSLVPGPPRPANDPGDGGGGGGGGPPNPPGLPSLRGSQRNSQDDELASQSTLTLDEAPRVSRREADKVTISPWPKHQHLEVWTAETVMAICLAANDGDRAAWEAWVWPALQPDADLDALNDQRYQSLDAKLSLALSRVITQAGDQARHVATKLRMRTKANARRGTFVMGREILAMILNR